MFADPVAHAGASSFPSGHAQSSVVLTSVLLVLVLPQLHGRRRIVAVAIAVAWAAAIGFSRVALGVHYVSDVLAGTPSGLPGSLVMVAAADLAARLRSPSSASSMHCADSERPSPDAPSAIDLERPSPAGPSRGRSRGS